MASGGSGSPGYSVEIMTIIPQQTKSTEDFTVIPDTSFSGAQLSLIQGAAIPAVGDGLEITINGTTKTCIGEDWPNLVVFNFEVTGTSQIGIAFSNNIAYLLAMGIEGKKEIHVLPGDYTVSAAQKTVTNTPDFNIAARNAIGGLPIYRIFEASFYNLDFGTTAGNGILSVGPDDCNSFRLLYKNPGINITERSKTISTVQFLSYSVLNNAIIVPTGSTDNSVQIDNWWITLAITKFHDESHTGNITCLFTEYYAGDE